VDSKVILQAGSGMLKKSWSLESDEASLDLWVRGRLKTRMETDLESLVPV